MIEASIVTWLLLFLGDFLSTFCYHVPEHVFGGLHLKTHHSSKQTFRHYAILTVDAKVLLDGILGALPYLMVAAALWSFSPMGTVLGLVLGQVHVWWRHASVINWRTPKTMEWLCHVLFITTPEQHWLHHQKTTVGFGDIFTFFDVPARAWLRFLRLLRLQARSLGAKVLVRL
jgi:Fatty acid hydroxylase superfamily